jgi:hypothetical protein
VDRSKLATGDPLVLSIDYRAHEPVGHAVFTVSMKRVDGTRIGSIWTGALEPEGRTLLPGTGSVVVELPQLPLLAGTYDLEVEISDPTRAHVMDRLSHAARFDVASDDLVRDPAEFLSLAARWTLP